MGRKPIAFSEVKRRLASKFGTRVTIIDSTYVSINKKATFIDETFGEWSARVGHVLGGGQHPKRGKTSARLKLRLPPRVWQQRIFAVHGDSVTLDISTLGMSHCRFIDRDFGEWWARLDHVASGQQHPKRAKTYTPTIEEFEAILRLRTDGIRLVPESYTTLKNKARFIDPEFGEWSTKAGRVMSGSGHPHRARMNSRISESDILERIRQAHGDEVQLDTSTFTKAGIRAKFIDKQYGEWWASPTNVMHGRGHPARRSQKAAKTMQKWPPVTHWHTQQLCYCASSYEFAVLTWLNENRFDYVWQIPFRTPFLTSRDRYQTYVVDLLITSGPFIGTYVEIKGFFREHDKKKWNWFSSLHKSELWNKSRLQQLSII